MYQRALAIFEKTLGHDHPTTAASLENYAILLRKLDRHKEANEFDARAEAIRARHAQQNPK